MIQIRNLTVEFNKGNPVLDGMNLDVPDGLRTVVIGESGSGKSIMLSAILRVLPADANVSGQILMGDVNDARAEIDLMTLSEKEMQHIRGLRLAYIPQGSGNSLNPLLKVGFQVAEPMMEFQDMKKPEALKKAIAWMEKLNLRDAKKVADSYPHTLSGGMKQRALIAMGMAAGAKIILADEPTKGLDNERIRGVIQSLNQMEDHTLLCVSHDLRFAREIADRISVMHQAKQVEYCTKEEFFENPLHPYSKMLLAALPENGLHCANHDYHKRMMEHHDQKCCPFYGWCPERRDQCQTPPEMVTVGTRKVRCHLYADGHHEDGNSSGEREVASKC